MLKSINHVLGLISTTQILGVIPLDLTLHFLVGTIITYTLLKRQVSHKLTFTIVSVLALIKEIYDIVFVYPAPWSEYVQDFCVTISYIALVWPIHIFNQHRLARRNRRHERDRDIVKY